MFNSIRIFVLRDITKIWKNIIHINPLTPELQNILQRIWAHKFKWNRDQLYFRLIFLDVFGSAPHDETISKSQEYQFLLFFDKFTLKEPVFHTIFS